MKATWIGYGKRFLQALRGAAPVILFFLTGFASVYALFGMQYVCVVSVVTVFFQMRHKKNDKTPRRYLRLLVTGTFLMICAYVSTLSLASCLLLNLLIPFVLVFTQSSQFNPKGYFFYAMIFVFLSLMPPDHLPGGTGGVQRRRHHGRLRAHPPGDGGRRPVRGYGPV